MSFLFTLVSLNIYFVEFLTISYSAETARMPKVKVPRGTGLGLRHLTAMGGETAGV